MINTRCVKSGCFLVGSVERTEVFCSVLAGAAATALVAVFVFGGILKTSAMNEKKLRSRHTQQQQAYLGRPRSGGSRISTRETSFATHNSLQQKKKEVMASSELLENETIPLARVESVPSHFIDIPVSIAQPLIQVH
jgi:hypothetical protein